MALIHRFAVVIGVGLLVMVLLEYALTRDDTVPVRFVLTATEATAPDAEPIRWEFRSNEIGNMLMDGKPATVNDVIERIRRSETVVSLTASDGDGVTRWAATVDPGGVVRFAGREKPATLERLAATVAEDAVPAGLAPTRQVTLPDVLAENIPTPTLTRVSYPTFSYHDAFPDAADEAEVVIDSYQEAPILSDRGKMPVPWREHYPDTLPPVAERLPRNPAVIRGPDGIGRYGGIWHRCTGAVADLTRKIGYESFIRFDPSGKIQPCLAYKWEVSDQNRVYTFWLRKGHRWSDGHPFTTEDILWVTNTLMGSDFAGARMDWMQQTDGRTRLYVDDVLDWPAFVGRVLDEAAGEAPSFGRQVASAGADDLLDLFRRARKNEQPDDTLRFMIVAKVNSLFREPAFFDPAAYASLDLDKEIDELETIGFSRLSADQIRRLNYLLQRRDAFKRAQVDPDALGPMEWIRLNLGLFRASYRPIIDRAWLRFVKVEAVPDENGDTSHIIRFTFPKPNSIFLDKTGTFMFYLSVFDIAKHYTARWHPLGSKVLNTVDIYRWEDLFARIRREAAMSAPTPGGQLWTRLDESIRDRIAANPPTNESDKAYKQEVVDAINAVLRDPTFYDPKAFGGIDLDSELKNLVADGNDKLRLDPVSVRRANDLRDRADLLQRAANAGVGDLSDEERFRLNLWMFRAAYDGDRDDNPLVAYNRENALNVAAQNHPRKYTTWSTRFRSISNYHPTENRHNPTLRAWRVVTEPVAQTQLGIRNPYYYKVDPEGNQLPYIDAVETLKEDRPANVLLKMASGNVDFQVREIAFEHYTYLKSHEEQGDYELRLWANDYCGEVTFGPLQCHKDPEYARLQAEPRFRHALSMAINRQEIIDVVYGGIGEPAQYCAPEGSPYYNEAQAKAFVEYDLGQANAILDEMGLDKRRADGVRLLWSGKPLIMNVETEEERPLNVVQMVCEYWRKLGIDTRMQVRTYALLSRLSSLGLLDIRVHKEGGNFFGPIMAGGYAPTHPAEATQWSTWAQYLISGGRSGEEPPDHIWEIQKMWEDVIYAPDEQQKYAAWQRLATQTAWDLPIIAIMTSPGKLVYVRNNFKNVPKLAFAGWIAHDPGNCCPEAFYFEPEH